MSETIETRLARVERELAILKARASNDKSNWIAEITGIFKDDPDFEEIVRGGGGGGGGGVGKGNA